MDIAKCVEAVKAVVARYREYDYCDAFLDAMERHAESYVPRLAGEFACEDELVDWVRDYIYCVCTGLELSEGETWRILGPLPRYTPDDIVHALTREHPRFREESKRDIEMIEQFMKGRVTGR